MPDINELGTPLGAVEGCVDMMARALSVDSERLHCWLDVYYQLRTRYDAELAAAERAHALMETRPAAPSAAAPETGAPSSVCAATPAAETSAGEPEVSCVERPAGEDAPKLGDGIPAPSFSGYGARLRRETFGRLCAARQNGATIPRLRDACEGALKDDTILKMLRAEKVDISAWQQMSAALDKIEKEAEA